MSTEGSGLIRSALEEAASGLERLRRNDAALAAVEAAGGGLAQAFIAGEAARSLSMPVIALTGRPASPLAELAQVEVCTPAGRFADRVQELHIKVIHVLIELVEHQLNLADAAH